MKIATEILKWTLAAGLLTVGNVTLAQCQRGAGGQSAGSVAATNVASSPYSQLGLGNGYNQTALGPATGYNQFMGMVAANDAYNRNMRMAAAQSVQAQSMMVRTQIAQVKAMRQQMEVASAAMRKAAKADKAEALAARQERESARRSKSEVAKAAAQLAAK